MAAVNLYELLGLDLEKLVDDLERKNAESPAEKPYLQPSEQLLGLPKKGKVVTLDAAIMAVHLIAGKVAFKGFPGLLASVVRQIESKVKSSLENKAVNDLTEGFEGVTKRVGFIVSIARKVGEILRREAIEAQKEAKIRLASIEYRKQLYAHALKPSGKKRTTQYVHTRHWTPKQRKPNGSRK